MGHDVAAVGALPIPHLILDGLNKCTVQPVAVRGEQRQGCDRGRMLQDPDFALHQTSQRLPVYFRTSLGQPADGLGGTGSPQAPKESCGALSRVRPQNYHIVRYAAWCQVQSAAAVLLRCCCCLLLLLCGDREPSSAGAGRVRPIWLRHSTVACRT